MRFVDRKSVPAPDILSSPLVERATAEIQKILNLDPAKIQHVRSKFDASIYRQPALQNALIELFAGKCAYCETPFDGSEWDIDQLRPKQSAAQFDARNEDLHHYAWLAYDWGNLYPTCIDCNRGKRNLFPVDGKRAPLGTPLETIYNIEKGTMVDPCVDQPHEHFVFDTNGAVLARSERAAITIRILNLNRPNLVGKRLTVFSVLRQTGGSKRLRMVRRMLAPARPHSGALSILLFGIWKERGQALGLPPAQFDRLSEVLPRLLKAVGSRPVKTRRARVTKRKVAKRARPAGKARRSAKPKRKTPLTSEQRNGRAATSRLAYIELKNFKAIQHIRLSLPEKTEDQDGAPCLVLLGENATGKSSILEAIALAALGSADLKSLDLNSGNFVRRSDKGWKKRSPHAMSVEMGFYGLQLPIKLAVKSGARRFSGERKPATVLLGYGPHRYFSKSRTRRVRGRWGRVESMFNPLTAIPNPAHWLERADDRRFAAAVRALREILLLRTEDDFDRTSKGGVLITNHGQPTPLERLSEGYRSMLAMAVDIMREMLDHWDGLEEARGIVLVDEIETHLHPRWKMRVMGALRRAMPHVQFIVTTHDPLCLRGMSNGEVVVLNRTASVIDQLQDLPDIKGLRAEQLLTSDYFGLSSTSDSDMEADIAAYAARLADPADVVRPDERAALATVSDRISRRLVTGNTAAEQLVDQAIKDYLSTREIGTAEQLRSTRKRAISAVIEALQRPASDRAP